MRSTLDINRAHHGPTKNAVAIMTAANSTFPNGNPGIGFDWFANGQQSETRGSAITVLLIFMATDR